MQKFEMPEWISPSRPGLLKCSYVGRGDLPSQRCVQFEVEERLYTSLVPVESVDAERNAMSVSIFASLKDGSYLVNLPAETLTSGTTLQIRRDDPQLIHDTQ